MQENSKTFHWVMDVCTNSEALEWLNNHRTRCTGVMATRGLFFTHNRTKIAHMKTVSRTFDLTKAYCEKNNTSMT